MSTTARRSTGQVDSAEYVVRPGARNGARVPFLVDMNRVFEDFVVIALRDALRVSERSFPQGTAGKSLYLDRAKRVRLEPDISWWDGIICTFVGDVKYKRLAVAEVKHADLYQLHAYATAAALPGGLLIYAAGEAEDTIHEVVHAGKRLQIVTLDLQGSPHEILAGIRGVAEIIRRLRRQAMAAASLDIESGLANGNPST